MKPLVSVIVPVYKVEKYINRCLDSLFRQSLRAIEIILVDDASPDRCSEICEEYAAKDARFRVYHHAVNRGLSVARNTGIAHASAEYLMFVDSDDWVHEDFCKLPYECAILQQADLVMFSRQRIKASKKSTRISFETYGSLTSGYKTKWETLNLLSSREVGNAAWNKLYRKELFNNITYPEGYLFEDVGTTYKLILASTRIYYLNKILYYWNTREGSIMTLRTEKAFTDWITMTKQQYYDLTECGIPKEKIEQRLKNIAIEFCIKRKNLSDSEYALFAESLLSCKKIPEYFSWRRKILFILFKYCPFLFELVCRFWGHKFDI